MVDVTNEEEDKVTVGDGGVDKRICLVDFTIFLRRKKKRKLRGKGRRDLM